MSAPTLLLIGNPLFLLLAMKLPAVLPQGGGTVITAFACCGPLCLMLQLCSSTLRALYHKISGLFRGLWKGALLLAGSDFLIGASLKIKPQLTQSHIACVTPLTIYPAAVWDATVHCSVNLLCTCKPRHRRQAGWCLSTAGTQHTSRVADGKARRAARS